MGLGQAFWIIMLLWLVFGVWRDWPSPVAIGGNVLIFVLFLLLGWAEFGAPLRG